MSGEMTGSRRPVVSLSWVQYLRLLSGIVSIVAKVLFSLVSGIFRGKKGTRTFGRHVVTSGIRALTSSLGILELQYLSPTWDQVYQKFCRLHQIEPNIVATEAVTGFWLGNKAAKCVIIHFHGGGFALDITYEHLQFWHKIQAELATSGVEFSVLFPAYTLTPHAAYPTQFQQAIDALSYVLHDLGRDAQDVIITGDSAGANICVAILSHLLHPSPDVTRLQVKGKLRGVVLISPWLSFDTSWPSMTHNAKKDIDKKEALESWAKQYLNGKASDNYAEAILAPIEWWRGSQAERVLVVAGSDEVFIDSIKAWVENFRAANNETRLAVAEGEFHIEPFIVPNFGDHSETGPEREIKAWLRDNL